MRFAFGRSGAAESAVRRHEDRQAEAGEVVVADATDRGEVLDPIRRRGSRGAFPTRLPAPLPARRSGKSFPD